MSLSVPAKNGGCVHRMAAAMAANKAKATKVAVGAIWLGSGLWALSSAHWSGTVIVTTFQFSSLFGPLGICIAATAAIVLYLAYKAASLFMRCIAAWRNRKNEPIPSLESLAPADVQHPVPGAKFVAPPDASPETALFMQNLFDENAALRRANEQVHATLMTVSAQYEDVLAKLTKLTDLHARLSPPDSPVMPQLSPPAPDSPKMTSSSPTVVQG